MMCMYIEMFHVSVIVPNATTVVYGILFGGMHPIMHVISDGAGGGGPLHGRQFWVANVFLLHQ